ncbi:FHA domain-containing protein [Anaerocolumna sedimenticola]|uniref:FHA domain-containing protein n=1 Tax=Anaerocolumna sedimenticola TaxID=2696063 RepID=A0A6P1TJE3_9FIRM|nr:FHA domain-containing protein [Anaerocolumna sedimenticola]QHQ60239.1 FHA domain-containing protein [Anaerocolumna sedimenticola]
MKYDKTQVLWREKDDPEQNKTVILSKIVPNITYFLISVESDNKKIKVDHFPFVIGKQTKGSDLVAESTSVSRRHARITKEGESIFLTDLNSTNGSYLNGIKLTENKPYLLADKDEIMLSQTKYVWSVNSEK